MKSTGIVRKVDQLGRIVIPIELRRTLGIDAKDDLEMTTDGDMIVYRKFVPRCAICGSEDGLKTYRDKMVCADCVEKAKSLR